MKTLAQLRTYYETTLMGELQTLEQQRLDVAKKLTIAIVVVLALAAGILLAFGRHFFANPMLLLFPLVIGVIIIGAMAHYLSRNYVSGFKAGVIANIVKFIDESLTYRPNACMPHAVFKGSKIFQHSADRYRGDDWVSGKVGATALEFSEIHAEYKTETRDSKGHTQTHWHTIFKGLFFRADFNKNFNGSTVVLPDTAERLFGSLGKWLQSINFTRGDLIKLEDPDFEREFAVYGDDQIEARYILSTSLMRRILDFKQRTGKKIHLSFVHSCLYVAIPYTKDLFEPRLFHTLLDFQPIQQYFQDLQLAISIVEDLNLNTRIWTKV